MPDWNSFKIGGVAGDSLLTDQLRTNICCFLDCALLNAGYFLNVATGTRYPPYGAYPSKLRPSDDIRYPSGIAFDGLKSNWVWENDVTFTSHPIQISGIYINGTYTPNNTGTFNINYPLGRVIFTSPQDVTKTYKVEYSYKYYNVYPDTVPWFKQLTQGTWRFDDSQATSQGSGLWSIFPDSRSQLPAVVVEISPSLKTEPIGLGGGQWISKDVLVHVFSETAFDRDNLLDMLSYQWQKTLFSFDKNKVAASDAYPLNAYGYLVNPSSTYTYLVNNYLWNYMYVDDVNVQRSDNDPQGVYNGVARWTCKVYMANVL